MVLSSLSAENRKQGWNFCGPFQPYEHCLSSSAVLLLIPHSVKNQGKDDTPVILVLSSIPLLFDFQVWRV